MSPLVATTTTLRADWDTFGNGPTHTGYFPVSLSGSTFSADWSVSQNGPVNQAAIGDGRVYVTANGALTAFDAIDGHVVWNYTFPNASSINPPTFDSGQVYVQRVNHSADTQLWSIHANTGVPYWVSSHSAQWDKYMAPTVANGRVFVDGGYYGGMYGFQQSDGQQLFFFSGLPQFDQWITPTSCTRGWRANSVSTIRQQDRRTG